MRTSTARALVALAFLSAAPASVFAKLDPLAAAKPAGKKPKDPACSASLEPRETFPLVMCVERERTSSDENLEANLFPYSSNVTTFGNPGYRVQYLFTSAALMKVASRAVTIESMHARATSFSASRTTDYQNASADQWIRVYSSDGAFGATFDLNANGPLHLNYEGIKRVSQMAGTTCGGKNQNPAALSDWIDRGMDPCTRNDLDSPIDFQLQDPAQSNLLVDFLMRLSSTQNPGAAAVWDISTDAEGGGCPEDVKRAFGSHRFLNPNNLTTALSLDNKGFVWVFRGLALPPPATVQQQIAELIRLLLTPEEDRCSYLDVNLNGLADDEPVRFPDGANYDPISPQVTSGSPITGEEEEGAVRDSGWIPFP